MLGMVKARAGGGSIVGDVRLFVCVRVAEEDDDDCGILPLVISAGLGCIQ